jgi:secretion/DNA translocation related TadE-like protein
VTADGGRVDRTARDRGSASVWAAGATAALLALVGLVVAVGAAAVTRHQAASAADLAALAAAAHAWSGQEYACGRARWVTDQMRVQLTGCRLDGWDALVEVAAQPPDLLVGFGPATARARAGPVPG